MIYEPAEDSYLLQEQVKKYCKNKKVLDLGTGSGIQALTALKFKASSVLASDISEEVVNHVKTLKIPVVKSNLFSNIKEKFDLIIFNPPYLPLDEREPLNSRLATTGGKKGHETLAKFLKQAKLHLNKNGIILIVVSTLTPNVEQLIKKNNFTFKILSEQKIPQETLKVYLIKENQQ